MSSLGTLRDLVYVYLGTTSNDPAYPAASVRGLLNAAGNKYIADVQMQSPSTLRKTTTLTAASSTSRLYALPTDYARYLDVRLTDSSGQPLTEVRDDEINRAWSRSTFAISGPDAAAVLETSSDTPAGTPIYLKYVYQPAELVDDGDVPSWMPPQFHDLLAREGAVDAFGLGAESAASPTFLNELADRRSQYWFHLGKRGVQPLVTRDTE